MEENSTSCNDPIHGTGSGNQALFTSVYGIQPTPIIQTFYMCNAQYNNTCPLHLSLANNLSGS
jgi:hypothetical protein